MSTGQQSNEPLLGGSIQNSSPNAPSSSSQQQQQQQQGGEYRRWGGYTEREIVLMIILFVFLVSLIVLLGGMYIQAGKTPEPVYVMFNATIYASSTHYQPNYPKMSTQQLKSGQNPFEYAQAVVIDNKGRFYDVGFDDAILQNEKYNSLPHINMNKAVISPSFADAHGHMMSYGLGFLEPDLHAARSMTEVVQLLLDFAKEQGLDPTQPSDKSWITGGRWDESQWGDDPDYDYYIDPDTKSHPFPTHQMLDKAFPKLGLALKRVDGHGCWCNQAVLDVITLPDKDPVGGAIIRDQDGKPTGVFLDTACDILFSYPQTFPTDEHKTRALTKAIGELNKYGITSVHDASLMNGDLFAKHLLLNRRSRTDKTKNEKGQTTSSFTSLYDPFPLRLHGMVDADGLCSPTNYTCPKPYPFKTVDQSTVSKIKKDGAQWVKAPQFDLQDQLNAPALDILPKILDANNGRFDTMGTKLMSDGALGSWGAFLLEDYSDKPGSRGIQMYTKDQLNHAVLTLAKQGFSVSTHAIGDAAVQQVLDAYVYAANNLNGTDNQQLSRQHFASQRHRVEHFQIIPDTWIEVMEDLQILPSMQPIHAPQDRSFAESRLGNQRLNNEGYKWRKIEQNLGLIALGTDFPVSSPNLVENIYAAVEMKEMSSDLPPFLPQNALSIVDALMGVTGSAAYAQHREHDLGRIAKGYIADFVIMQQDWLGFSLPDHDQRNIGQLLKDTVVLATFIDGNAVFEHQDVKIESIQAKSRDKVKEQYSFSFTPNATSTKQPWSAIRQPAIPVVSHTVHNVDLLNTINQLKLQMKEYLQTKQPQSLLLSLPDIFTPFSPTKTESTTIPTQQELELWANLRYLAPSHRLSSLLSFYIDPSTPTYTHQPPRVFSQTSDKTMEALYPHDDHDVRDATFYRSNVLYPVYDQTGPDSDEKTLRGYIQPRIPPCVEHMGIREAAQRRNFKYPHLNPIIMGIDEKEEILQSVAILN